MSLSLKVSVGVCGHYFLPLCQLVLPACSSTSFLKDEIVIRVDYEDTSHVWIT